MATENTRNIFVSLTIASIQANATSLAGQLADYDFIKVTDEQARRLNELEQSLHILVKEITEG